MKKALAFLMILCMAVNSISALAETSGPSKREVVEKIVLEQIDVERARTLRDENEEVVYQIGDTEIVTIPDTFFFLKECEDGYLDLFVSLGIGSSESCVNISDYDFLILLPSDETGRMYDLYWPEHIYLPKNGFLQEAAYPVVMPEEGTILLMHYIVPETVREFALVYTNIWENDADETLSDGGPMDVWIMERCALDFQLKNDTDLPIIGVYVVPETESTWGSSRIGFSIDPGTVGVVEFGNSGFEERTDENWKCKIIFEGGSSYSFSMIYPGDILTTELKLDTDGDPVLTDR